ncbi:MAG: 3-deoxy-D-manno-octulosonic acid kinase [marine benthic group bacterium]|nr:3-deoxy-D-manno-octulosonic acid kinase [Gemmatimonadota bacterium]
MRPPRPDLIPDRFELLATTDTLAVVRSDFREAFESSRLIRCAAADISGAEPLKGGRGAARILTVHAFGEIVVRPYRRGGWIRHVVRKRYFIGSRPIRELNVTERLRVAGAPVPEAVAAVHRKARPGPGYEACIATRRIAGTMPAAESLHRSRSGEIRLIMEEIGRSIRACHDAGGWHADLNAWNLLVSESRPDLPVMLIDWDRGRIVTGGVTGRSRRANLARLQRSLRKLGLHSALDAWPHLERGYAASPEPRPAA